MRVVAGFLLIFLIPLFSMALQPTEYQVKTALIFNFLRFVELDETRYLNNSVAICSYKGMEINEELKKIDGLKISDLTIRYKEISKDEEIGDCSVLIVNKRDDTSSLKSLLENTYKKKILTISDIERYGEYGVVINMFLENGRVRFEINLEAAEKAGVRISSRLLTLARIIKKIKW